MCMESSEWHIMKKNVLFLCCSGQDAVNDLAQNATDTLICWDRPLPSDTSVSLTATCISMTHLVTMVTTQQLDLEAGQFETDT